MRKLREENELFYSYLKQNGLKKTYQKDLILETFLNTEGHLSVEDVYSLVKKRDKKVGIVTVFRTLKSLAACGIAREITLGDGLTRFEHSYHHPYHHHLVCTECQKAIEFVCPELERIQNEIIQKYHFQPIYHRFQTYGICEDCREHHTVGEIQKHDTELIFARDAVKMTLSMENRCLDFYRNLAMRDLDSGGRAVFEHIGREEETCISDLNAKLEDIISMEKGLDNAPIFLHFNPYELDALLPDPYKHEANKEIKLDAKTSTELARTLDRRVADYFRQYADKFGDTQGSKILLDYAAIKEEQSNLIRQRLEGMTEKIGTD
jgi:Fur family ferric uptake transcriptional regulator